MFFFLTHSETPRGKLGGCNFFHSDFSVPLELKFSGRNGCFPGSVVFREVGAFLKRCWLNTFPFSSGFWGGQVFKKMAGLLDRLPLVLSPRGFEEVRVFWVFLFV